MIADICNACSTAPPHPTPKQPRYMLLFEQGARLFNSVHRWEQTPPGVCTNTTLFIVRSSAPPVPACDTRSVNNDSNEEGKRYLRKKSINRRRSPSCFPQVATGDGGEVCVSHPPTHHSCLSGCLLRQDPNDSYERRREVGLVCNTVVRRREHGHVRVSGKS